MVYCNSDSASDLGVDASSLQHPLDTKLMPPIGPYLQLAQCETTAGTDAVVVSHGLAAHCWAQWTINWAWGDSRGLSLAGQTAALLAAWLRNVQVQLISGLWQNEPGRTMSSHGVPTACGNARSG